ncbi:FdhF/YdeP family oxidoreductase [Acidocella sp. KAb 2-4]|uniref:FdhF/YdeP family oxidoreductase n=1 Tax=Acidocella sp. KAb 2-4 TaxID=2885158 RepID=UPI001D070B72|nr:FdhF/YdeP family oxidoreductase [Acidocella sp. KAb 2-4]MCB5944722.1 FdhF/YdeP family oxidoreductase [Acidocella sp. KAb 2-4]
MQKDKDVAGVRPYDKPAGGWGALRATAKAIAEQMHTVDASRILLRTNQPDGFDCPGCAWPDKKHSSTFQFCENGAKAVTWEATKKRVPPEFFAKHSVSELLSWTDHALEDAGRVTHPMRYNPATDHYEPVEWETAFAEIGAQLRALPDPDMAEFYTSGRASNEAAFLLQIFAREYGTNNFPDCSNMCHEATSVGLAESLGFGKGTVPLEGFEHCDLIISIGHNPGTNHPRMMGTLHEVSRRGVPIIVLNPLRERALERFADPQNPVEMATLGATPIASSYLQLKVGGDAMALKGIMKALLALEDKRGGVLDHAFIAAQTIGFEALAADLRATSWEAIEAASGLSRATLAGVAEAYARANATIVTYGMGVTQHRHGTGNVQQITNLLLMRGNFGKPGAGICPLRGHSNVQGNRTVGITEKPSAELLRGIEQTFGFTPPAGHGHDAVAAMQAILDGRSRALICTGGNLAVALSDPEACAAAMRKLELGVHLTTKLNRSHLLVGRHSYIFPVLGRTESDVQASGEQAVTVEDSMSMVHASRGKLPPASPHLRSEPAVIAGIAKATLPASRLDWDWYVADYDRIRDAIEKVFPAFASYNERIRKPGGFQLPMPPNEFVWNTPAGKAMFRVYQPEATAPAPDVLTLTTLRSHNQYNTTIYDYDDRYRGVFGRRDVVFMNAEDLAARGLKHGSLVDVETAFGSLEPRRLKGFTAIAYNIPRGSIGAYYPEANCLVPLDYIDHQSGTPGYKSVPVRISKAA